MVPTTVNGIILLLVVLFPGFFYVLRREPHTPSRKFSAFRETMRVIVASTFAYGAAGALVLLGTLVLSIWVHTAWLEALGALQAPYRYQDAHPLRFLVGGVSIVALATLLSALCGGLLPGKLLDALADRGPAFTKRIFSSLRDSITPIASSWWGVLEAHPDKVTVVAITLNDDSTLVGNLFSYSMDADESQDRDIVLQSPLFLLKPGEPGLVLPDPIAIVSAREIKYLTVNYREKPVQPQGEIAA